MPRTLVVRGFLRLTGAMTWNNGAPYVEELAPRMYGYEQPDGGWMVNNCGVVVNSAGTAVLVDTTSTSSATDRCSRRWRRSASVRPARS